MIPVKVSVKDGKVCEKILTIEVEQDRVDAEYEEFYRSVAPKAKIPGFRPGKAPRQVLEMHFQGDARKNVLEHLISESYREALREKSLAPLGMPQIEEVKFEGKNLSYKARIEVRPKIKLSRVTGLAAKKERAEIKPEEIDVALKHIQESLATYKAVEDRPAAMGDFVIADYVCLAGGKEVEKRANDWFEMREDEFLKGLSPQLVGARPGEDREARVAFPEKGSRKELAGKEALFKLKIREIKSKSLPALDDELAREAGEFKSLAELREKVSRDLQAEKEKEKEAGFEKALLDELVKMNKIDLPEGLVARRLEHLVEHTLENLKKQGMPESERQKAQEKLRQELAAEARRQVHLAFLLDEIAMKENISATEEELKAKYQNTASQIRQSVEAVEKFYAEREDAREALADRIRNEKVIEFLKRNAKLQ